MQQRFHFAALFLTGQTPDRVWILLLEQKHEYFEWRRKAEALVLPPRLDRRLIRRRWLNRRGFHNIRSNQSQMFGKGLFFHCSMLELPREASQPSFVLLLLLMRFLNHLNALWLRLGEISFGIVSFKKERIERAIVPSPPSAAFAISGLFQVLSPAHGPSASQD
jgi:hypothetical protein